MAMLELHEVHTFYGSIEARTVDDATGATVTPASPLLSSQWPHAIPGHRLAPLGRSGGA